MTSFLFGREEEERVTSYSGRGESRIFRVYCKTLELEAYRLDKDCALPKEMLNSLTEGYAALFDCQAGIAL